ncbi:MAG: hypothetical protein ILM98_12525 [Kiritimatiellae bacterium]|nr:hypothetical protein [Kiritimatiellia bacterium]
MKKAIPYCVAIVFAIAFAAVAARNRALSADLEEAQAALAAFKAAPQPEKNVAVPRPASPRPPVAEPTPPPEPEFDQEKFDKAVEERVAERVAERDAQREAEREERRRAWQNETEEQREARRQEFHARIKEHAAEQLAAFVEKTGLNEEQQMALEGELGLLDSRVREISEEFASALDEGVPFGFETQMQLMNNISAAVLDTFAGLDEALPEGWRESDEGFVVMMGIDPGSVDSLFRAMRRTGMRGMGMPFMRGGPPPGGRRGRQQQ